MTLNAEIVSIGDEITSGAMVDTNSAWLSLELGDLGIRTLYHTTVGDELEPLVAVLRAAVQRSELVLITGGIGPTEDDLTRQAVANMLGVSLVQNPVVLAMIKENFRQRQRIMPESNVIQSYFPEGAAVIDNPHGTAPGFIVEKKRDSGKENDTFCLMVYPGVPAEMKEMWNIYGKVITHDFNLRRTGNNQVVMNYRIHCFGLGESELEARLPHLISRSHTPTVGITVKEGIITLRIRAEGDTEEICQTQLEETKSIIKTTLGDIVFGEEDVTLPSVVCDILRRKKKTVSVLEWGTQGLLAAKVDPDIFMGGITVSPIIPFTKKSLDGIRCSMLGDYTMIIGSYPQIDKTNVSDTVFIGLYDRAKNEILEENTPYRSHPAIINDLFCYRAFDLLRHHCQ